MNDLRSPIEDRPYRPASRSTPKQEQPAENYQDVYAENYQEYSLYERIRYSRWFPLASVLTAVLVFGVIISYAYKQGAHTGVNATTPVVQADNTNYKEKPADPGGMDVPFQDAVVFDNLQNKDAAQTEGNVESLLPPPEQALADKAPALVAQAPQPEVAPVAVPAADNAGNIADAITTSEPQNAPVVVKSPEAVPAPAALPVDTAPAVIAQEAPVKAEPVKTATSAPEKVATPAAKPAKIAAAPVYVPPAAKIESGSARIQLGAFRDETAAKAAWAKMRGQYPVLANVTPQFVRADLGAKGIFYRVQGMNLSQASASELCHSITSKGGSCIVQK